MCNLQYEFDTHVSTESHSNGHQRLRKNQYYAFILCAYISLFVSIFTFSRVNVYVLCSQCSHTKWFAYPIGCVHIAYDGMKSKCKICVHGKQATTTNSPRFHRRALNATESWRSFFFFHLIFSIFYGMLQYLPLSLSCFAFIFRWPFCKWICSMQFCFTICK